MSEQVKGTAVRAGAGRRLSRRVLTPLLVGGLAVVGMGSTGATLAARHAAVSDLDARAEAIHAVAAQSLRRSGRVGPAAATAARVQGGSVVAAASAKPLPGGRAKHSGGGNRVYEY